MSLPTSQQRALNHIGETLADDPGLGPLFAIFARLADHEAMPVTERLTAQHYRRWPRRMPPAVVTLVGLAMATGALLILSLRLSGPLVCPGTVTAVAARMQHAPTVRQPACTSQQAKPGKPARVAPRAEQR
jgi:hypothetical protein